MLIWVIKVALPASSVIVVVVVEVVVVEDRVVVVVPVTVVVDDVMVAEVVVVVVSVVVVAVEVLVVIVPVVDVREVVVRVVVVHPRCCAMREVSHAEHSTSLLYDIDLLMYCPSAHTVTAVHSRSLTPGTFGLDSHSSPPHVLAVLQTMFDVAFAGAEMYWPYEHLVL